MMIGDSAWHAELHRRALTVVRSGVLACRRCGGSGQYAHYGVCFRCGGSGTDPEQPKHPAKSKTMARQREWASHFDADGRRIA